MQQNVLRKGRGSSSKAGHEVGGQAARSLPAAPVLQSKAVQETEEPDPLENSRQAERFNWPKIGAETGSILPVADTTAMGQSAGLPVQGRFVAPAASQPVAAAAPETAVRGFRLPAGPVQREATAAGRPEAAAATPLKTAGSGSGNGTVQRVVTQILPSKKKGKIGEVIIVGRPDNVYSGTKGDHMTAFTTIQVGIENMLRDKTLREVTELLAGLVSKLYQLPGMELTGTVPQKQLQRLNEKLGELHEWVAYFRRWRAEKKKQGKMLPFEQTFPFRKQQEEELMDEEQDMIEDVPEPEDEIREEHVGFLQLYINAYLEARELVPLSTINTKAINAPLAGKGKGESARVLEAFELGLAGGDDMLFDTIMGLFDARAAAVVMTTKDENVAPGIGSSEDGEALFNAMVRQHLQTLETFYPKSMQRIREQKLLPKLWDTMYLNIKEKIEENEKAKGGDEKKAKKGKNVGTAKKYVSAGIIVENGIITDVQFAGRSKSPFSGTMGAHVTAWVVMTDRIWSGIAGKTIKQATIALLNIILESEKHLKEALGKIKPDTKQLFALNFALSEMGASYTKLQEILEDMEASGNIFDRKEPQISPWERVAHLQDAITSILDVMNVTPGATLYVAETKGSGEAKHRAVLLRHMENYGSVSVEEVREAIEGLMDIKKLDQHISVINSSIKHEGKERQQELDALNDVFETKFSPKNKLVDVKHLLKEHHYDMISEAYPGALRYIGMEEHLEDDDYYESRDEEQDTNVVGEDGVDDYIVYSVAEFLKSTDFKTDKQILVVSGTDWTCYIRCVLHHLGRIDSYDTVMNFIGTYNVNIYNGVQINSKTEENIREIIAHVTGRKYHVHVTHAVNGLTGTSATTDGERVPLVFTGAHFNLLR